MLTPRRRLRFEGLESRRLLAAVDIASDLIGQAGHAVSVPISIDNAAGVRAAEIRIRYDTSLLDLDSDDVTAGTVWNERADTQITSNVDDAAGTVVIFVSASESLSSVAGSLALLSFTISSSAASGQTTAIDLTETVLNEGGVSLSPAPVAGSDSTDGLLTISATAGDDRISGTVYADTNGNSSPDSHEGIPGVLLNLRHTGNGTEQQVRTGSDGTYEFENLPPGSYEITQQHPAAYMDGGDNSLSVILTAGQVQSGQNFREEGLLPQYVYNRLLTTTVQEVGSTAWTDQVAKINADASTSTSTTSTASATFVSAAVNAAPVNADPVNADHENPENENPENEAAEHGADGIVSAEADSGGPASSVASTTSIVPMLESLPLNSAPLDSPSASVNRDDHDEELLRNRRVDEVMSAVDSW